MAKSLTAIITNQINNKRIKPSFIFKINSVDRSAYLKDWSISFDKSFGSASATFNLNNNSGIFGEGGDYKIQVGDVIELIEQYQGDSTEFKSFYGQVKNRSINKTATTKLITITCLDYISLLQNWDIDLSVEGTKIDVKNEILTPNFLPSPNEKLAQVFDFKSDNVATTPVPLIYIREIDGEDRDLRSDGFEIQYATGQLLMGFPLNAEENYEILSSYSHYTKGVYLEDVLETLLTTADGYGNYLFGEATAQAVIDNHLTTTFLVETGASEDTMSPNLTSSVIDIETTLAEDYTPTVRNTTTLAQDYATDVSGIDMEVLYLTDASGFPSSPDSGETTITAYLEDDEFEYTGQDSGNILTGITQTGDKAIHRESFIGDSVWYDTGIATTTLYLTDTSGLPESGTGSISGDTFTWTGKGSGNTLTGVSGLGVHEAGEYFKYEKSCAAGQLWYLSYSNVSTDLTSSDFTLSSGISVDYFDKKFGRIILDSAISIAATVTCNTNYTFSTLQSTGVEINSISFYSRELDNRYAAIEKLREYAAPNWIIRTEGDDKIWASYLYQKTNADYTLNLIKNLNYLEDKDIYTRVLFYAKNSNPTNLMFDENVGFVTTGHNYIGHARKQRVYYNREEGDWYVFRSLVSDAGYITVDTAIPLVYLGEGEAAVPINNTYHTRTLIPARGEVTTDIFWDKKDDDDKDIEYVKTTYYSYKIFVDGYTHFSPDHEVVFRDAVGNIILTIQPNDPEMDYVSGTYHSPSYRNSPQSSYTSISTASFTQYLLSDDVEIDYDRVEFKLRKSLFQDPEAAIVSADFDYFTAITPIDGAGKVIDGRFDTQVYTAFFAEPPQGYYYAILDFGSVKTIQALDLVSGFFIPEPNLKFDVDMKLTLKYSLDNVDYYDISDKTNTFSLGGGDAISFEEEDLGVGFQCRYLAVVLEGVKVVEYKDGCWPVAFTEISAYSNIIVKGESKLISTTETSESIVTADTTINVLNTAGFTEPESGEDATAYLIEDDDNYYSFTYTGLTSTSFTGCVIESGVSVASTTQVSQSIETDGYLYDTKYILPQLGDRIYKENKVDDTRLYTQTQITTLADAWLEEFVKNHNTIQVDVMSQPFLKVGHTVSLVDSYNNISDNYFIEAVSGKSNGGTQLTLARYRADS